MNIPKDNNDLIDSPLHQLELQMANARSSNKGEYDNFNSSYNIDRESIYSFDSVSTNGRLLDRLGLDNDEFEDYNHDFDLSKRDSVASVQSTGRLLDRLGLDDEELAMAEVNAPKSTQKRSVNPASIIQDRRKPISVNSSINVGRAPPRNPSMGYNAQVVNRNNERGSVDERVGSRENRPNVKTSPVKSILPKRSSSIDSFRADIRSANSSPGSSNNNSDHPNYKQNKPFPGDIPLFTRRPSTSKQINHIQSITPGNPPLKMLGPGFFPQSNIRSDNTSQKSSSSHERLDMTDDADDEYNFCSSGDSVNEFNVYKARAPLSSPSVNSRTPSTPVLRSSSTGTSMNKLEETPPTKRIASDSTNTTPTTPSLHSTNELSPKSRTQLAGELRKQGKHREASYQLRLAANVPNNFPKAMYLYALALRYGQGVKQNDRHSLKWLCKCVILSTDSNSNFAAKLNDLEPEDMIGLISKELEKERPIDPNELYDYYSKLQNSQLTKIINATKSQQDIVSSSYYELGNALVNGWGLLSKNEITGMSCLCKAASSGSVNSMVQLGEIWCSKSKYHKKDHYKAASWLRLSEIFGVTSIGNSWIYKDKYMDTKSKNKNRVSSH